MNSYAMKLRHGTVFNITWNTFPFHQVNWFHWIALLPLQFLIVLKHFFKEITPNFFLILDRQLHMDESIWTTQELWKVHSFKDRNLNWSWTHCIYGSHPIPSREEQWNQLQLKVLGTGYIIAYLFKKDQLIFEGATKIQNFITNAIHPHLKNQFENLAKTKNKGEYSKETANTGRHSNFRRYCANPRKLLKLSEY